MVNHYKVLGVENFASIEKIKVAYRKLSKKLHPDVNDGDPFFTEKFKEIQEAYEQLTNSFKRQYYDAELQAYFDYLKNPYRDTPTDFEPEPEPEPEPPRRENIRKDSSPPAEKEMSMGSAIFSLIIIIGVVFACYKFISKALAHDDKPVTTGQQVAGNSYDTSTIDSSSEIPTQNIIIQDTSAAVESKQIETEDDNAYFTIGSTKQEVVKIQGSPLSIRNSYGDVYEWTFPGGGTVTFTENQVTEFNNSNNDLKVRLIEKGKIVSDGSRYFTIGSSKQGVLRIQGNPLSIRNAYGDVYEWTFPGGGTVTFTGNQVTEFKNYNDNLKVKL